MKNLYEIQFQGVRIHGFTREILHWTIAGIIHSKTRAIIANVNINAMNLASEWPWFRRFLNQAEYVFCDGHGVMLGARLCGLRLPEKITYAHWFPLFCDFCAENGFSLYFLGGEPGIAEQAALKLKERCPRLSIVGMHDGYFDKSQESDENRKVVEHINSCRPDILLTSFGMPLQEKWLSENWAQVNAKVALTGGACLDYMAGKSRRPPRWMTDIGLEWLGRFLYEPKRLWKRYFIGNPLFFWRLLRWRLGLRPPETSS